MNKSKMLLSALHTLAFSTDPPALPSDAQLVAPPLATRAGLQQTDSPSRFVDVRGFGLTTDFVTDPVQPVDREEPQDVIVADLTRVLTPTQAAREWDRVTRKPSHALVDLPADLEG